MWPDGVAGCQHCEVAVTWYVVRTNQHGDDACHSALSGAGFMVYSARYHDKRKALRLLFPHYLFVKAVHNWRQIYRVEGVKRLLMSGAEPGRINDDIIDYFRSQQVDGVIQLPRRQQRFKPGQRLMAMTGPFQNQIGLYQGMSPRDREIVLFSLFGKSVPMEFNRLEDLQEAVQPAA